ncbi:MAG: Fe-S cluster assembly ATPase SufC [Candidatus Enterosoma sp.]|nr:Fe-S cluster assembly ATPase SufC [Candidatus Enterosoma sp.]
MESVKIKQLSVSVDNSEIISDLSLDINRGDVIALLGPNGHGKSTLFHAILGNELYKVNSGDILFDGESILDKKTDERSRMGIFLAFQNPPEIPGVLTMDFLKSSIDAHSEKPLSIYNFYKEVTSAYKRVSLDENFINRNLNDAFSGGEKKRNEILQMLLLKPQLALLDEIDSGLDVDSIQIIADIINDMREKGTTFIVISHYQKLLDLIKPNRSAILVNGRIALEGDYSIAKRISQEGYGFLKKEYGVNIEKKESKQVLLGSCAVKNIYE